MEDTTIIFMSDHGFFMPGTVYQLFMFSDFELEMTLPTLIINIPKKVKGYKEIDEKLISNENRFVTSFDIYQTLSSIINKNTNSKLGSSLFQVTKSFNITNCNSLKINHEHCRFRKVES
jgi:arylsulfatase A-like enzyme